MGDLAANLTVSEKVENLVFSLETRGPVIVLATQKWKESADTIRLALESFKLSDQAKREFTVIPRIHPGAALELKEEWKKTISIAEGFYSSRIKFIWLEDEQGFKWNSDELSARATMTIAATGAGLRAAAYHGRTPVCTTSKDLACQLFAESGNDEHPLAMFGAGLSLKEPRDPLGFAEEAYPLVRAKQIQYLTPVRFNPEEAAERIRALALSARGSMIF